MASLGKLKKYRRKKFSRYKELNEIKTKNDEAYIVLKVDSIKDILSIYSSDERPIINDDFCDLIESKASFIPLDLPLVLEIQNNNFTSEEKILIRKLIKNHFTLKKLSKEVDRELLSRKARFLFTTGVICFSMIPILMQFDKLVYVKETLSIIASFSTWEYASLMFFEYDESTEEVIRCNHLAKIRVIYDKGV